MKGITLFIFGGVAEMDSEPPTAGAEIRMAIVGPIMSIMIGLCCYATTLLGSQGGWPDPILAVLGYLTFINVALAVFNMLPAFPLDGGRVLRGYLWTRHDNLRRATRTVSKIGAFFGAVLIALGIISIFAGNLIGGIWWFLIGMFLRGASQMSYRQLEIRHALEGEPVLRFMKDNPVLVPSSLSLQQFVDDYVYVHYFDMFPVLDDGQFSGCITTRDLKRVPREEWKWRTVGELTEHCADTNTVSQDTDAVEALATMSRTHKSRLLVANDGQLHGVITLKDLLSFLALKLDLEEGKESPPGLPEAVQHR